jgi:hypothetical protein
MRFRYLAAIANGGGFLFFLIFSGLLPTACGSAISTSRQNRQATFTIGVDWLDPGETHHTNHFPPGGKLPVQGCPSQ